MSSSNIKLSFIDISLILSCIFSNISVLEIGTHEYITEFIIFICSRGLKFLFKFDSIFVKSGRIFLYFYCVIDIADEKIKLV